MSWRKLDGTKLRLPIEEEVERTIIRELEAGYKLRICVGCDSQVRGEIVSFATVIVFLREGKGGFMFVKKEAVQQKMALRERMMSEVARSVGIAYEIADILSRHQVALEVHADINPDVSCKSHIALKEAMGYIKGMGYEFKAKPYAFASSSCADKVC